MVAANVLDYRPIVAALKPVLFDLPGKLVAIDGRPGVGKTTLGRFLAWTFNVSLIETDLFMIEGQGRLIYHSDEIDRIIERRLRKPRPVIVEGATVLRLLASIEREPDFLIYLTNDNAPLSEGSLALDLDAYDAAFVPTANADLLIALSHTG